MTSKDDFTKNEIISQNLTSEQWYAKLTRARISHGEDLANMPAAAEPVDFMSHILFHAENWGNRVEAATMLRIIANTIDPDKSSIDNSQPQESESTQITQSGELMNITDKEAWYADTQWAIEEWGTGKFDNFEEDYVAVYLKKVVGKGNNQIDLRKKCAEECCVPFRRIIIQPTY